jgi:hypothetical protein
MLRVLKNDFFDQLHVPGTFAERGGGKRPSTLAALIRGMESARCQGWRQIVRSRRPGGDESADVAEAGEDAERDCGENVQRRADNPDPSPRPERIHDRDEEHADGQHLGYPPMRS